ncbi:MAG: YdeI/OmpD-associated family protein [Anaerolineae bacterium]|nr:YdeI/OmpD-associated family protein [Anaerolineae bacterium]
MDITETFYAADRAEWRQWLTENHATAKEIWLLYYTKESGKARVPYIHAVEEALCFGWIDGIQKKIAPDCNAQRFTPRRPKGNWTELNKERARRLIASGQMTEAGLRVLPDLSTDSFQIADDILAALQADPQVWENFQGFPPIYVRIRVIHIESVRKQPDEFQKRLDKLVQKTRHNKMFGGIE